LPFYKEFQQLTPEIFAKWQKVLIIREADTSVISFSLLVITCAAKHAH